MEELFARVLGIARVVCFLAVFYLFLHNIVARVSRSPAGRALRFFHLLTAPLTSPVRAWMGEISDREVLARSLLLYLVLWLCLIAAGRLVEVLC